MYLLKGLPETTGSKANVARRIPAPAVKRSASPPPLNHVTAMLVCFQAHLVFHPCNKTSNKQLKYWPSNERDQSYAQREEIFRKEQGSSSKFLRKDVGSSSKRRRVENSPKGRRKFLKKT